MKQMKTNLSIKLKAKTYMTKNDEILQQQVLLLSSWVVTDDDLLAG